MKKNSEKLTFIGILLYSFLSYAQNHQVVRGPYLQQISQNGAVIRWRTDKPTTSKVCIGSTLNHQNQIVSDTSLTTEHELKINHLNPNTTYYYSIGTKDKLIPMDKDFHLKTLPKKGSTQVVRIWALGDFGSGTANQKAVLQSAIINFGNKKPDAWIWLGDNAYENGKDEEYQKNVFDVYQNDFFKNTNFYPSPGNHDYAGKHDSSIPPYFQIFTLPRNGESGGLASGTESYYAVDYGNVHLISLNTEEKNRDGTFLFDGKGAQFEWLEKDLKANKLPWVIVYFHKPPYTKGSHDSDKEDDLIRMRKNVTPIFEKYKVDVVIAGHSHVYERTFPIRNHTGSNNTFEPQEHIVESKIKKDTYVVDKNGQGVIYIVCGSGGKVGGQKVDYPLKSAVYSNNSEGGSMLFDIRGNFMEAKWIASNGNILDHFSIKKK